MHATLDMVFCDAHVDFNVPGKPNPPPTALLATFWKLWRPLATKTTEKYAIEFTDTSGTLAPIAVPLTTYVQIDRPAGYEIPSIQDDYYVPVDDIETPESKSPGAVFSVYIIHAP